MNNQYYGNCKVYVTSESLWFFNDQSEIDTGIHKSKHHGQMFPEVLKSRLRGTILQQCTIWYYKSKVVYIEGGKEKCGDDYIMVILED